MNKGVVLAGGCSNAVDAHKFKFSVISSTSSCIKQHLSARLAGEPQLGIISGHNLAGLLKCRTKAKMKKRIKSVL